MLQYQYLYKLQNLVDVFEMYLVLKNRIEHFTCIPIIQTHIQNYSLVAIYASSVMIDMYAMSIINNIH